MILIRASIDDCDLPFVVRSGPLNRVKISWVETSLFFEEVVAETRIRLDRDLEFVCQAEWMVNLDDLEDLEDLEP